ncbi:MAG: GNAT family N-acetyltransferase [Thermomicrobiaceae bacterium]|nr:GNAT family N-acetyltransferase [Thermomicrobiaceae bacterium]
MGRETGVSVREASESDAAEIARLVGLLMREHDLPPPPEERVLAAVRRVLGAPGSWYLVAEGEGRIVGALQVNQRFSTWESADYGYIEDFCVDPEWRGRGVGSALLDYLARWAAGRGWARLDLDVQASNRDAVRFYQRHGFEDTGNLYLRRSLPASRLGH